MGIAMTTNMRRIVTTRVRDGRFAGEFTDRGMMSTMKKKKPRSE
jgi:hypothetical protein